MSMLIRWLLLVVLAGAVRLQAHPADLSHLRVRMERDRVEFRFSMNVATFARVVTIDANQDNKVTFAEIEEAVPVMQDFLHEAVLVSVNDDETDIGEFKGFDCVWPNAQASEITPPDAGQRFVDLSFTRTWPKGVHEVWLGFQVFERLGNLHTIQCIFQQPGEHDTPVDFSAQEPDYLYDTGWTDDLPTTAAVVKLESAGALRSRMIGGVGIGVALLVGLWFWRKNRLRWRNAGVEPRLE